MPKVNLIFDPKEVIVGGYDNICPVAELGDPTVKICDITKLDKYYDDAEIDEVRAINILEYFPLNDVEGILRRWIKKLSLNGKLNVAVTELGEVAYAFGAGKLELEQGIKLIYGEQSLPWQIKKSGFTSQLLINVLMNLGLKILSVKIEDYNVYCSAQRVK